MELEVQKFLRSGHSLSELTKKCGIKTSEEENLVLLNYSQIDSPKTDSIVMECRGTVLEKESWNVAFFPMRRFFNYGEALGVYNFDSNFFSSAFALEKIDGSMIGLWSYKDQWHISTRGSVNAGGKVGLFDYTFKELVGKVIDTYPDFRKNLSLKYMYVFELVGPDNKVVIPYPERKLYLLTVRDSITLVELNYGKLVKVASELGIDVPKRVPCDSVSELKQKFEGIDEGYVCVLYSKYLNDGCSFQRVKVKNPDYQAIAHLKESNASSLNGLMGLVVSGKQKDFLSFFPEFKKYTDILSTEYEKYKNESINAWETLKELAKDKTAEGRKQFALKALQYRNSEFLFKMYSGKVSDWDSFVSEQREKNVKGFSKKLLEILEIRDMIIENVE